MKKKELFCVSRYKYRSKVWFNVDDDDDVEQGFPTFVEIEKHCERNKPIGFTDRRILELYQIAPKDTDTLS